jgi:hypothetical protein
MGSAAMDQSGDLALGYSASSSSINPAVRYSGRLPGDPLGTLESELSIIEGTGSQTNGLQRWGDYSSLRIDPSDDCTFWYINEYLKSNGAFNWSTRVGSFKFSSCGQQGGGQAFLTGYALNGPPLRNDFGGLVGMQFTVGASALNVNALGRIFITGNSGTHTVKLVQASTGTDVPGGSVSLSMVGGVPGQFKYASLANSITLQANTTYYVVSQEAYSGDQWYDSGAVSSTTAAAVNSSIYSYNSATWYSVSTVNTSYVPANFQYQ